MASSALYANTVVSIPPATTAESANRFVVCVPVFGPNPLGLSAKSIASGWPGNEISQRIYHKSFLINALYFLKVGVVKQLIAAIKISAIIYTVLTDSRLVTMRL